MSLGHEQQRVAPYRADQGSTVEEACSRRRYGPWSSLILSGLVLLGGLGLAPSCAEPTRSQSADPSRALTPVPACVRRMPPRRDADRGFMPQLEERDYWSLVFPGASRSEVPGDGRSCAGGLLFTDPVFQGTKPIAGGAADALVIPPGAILHGGGGNRLRVVGRRSQRAEHRPAPAALAPARAVAGGSAEAVVIPPDAILHGGGGNRLRVVWLRSHRADDGTAAGALALVRAVDDVAEAYAVGVYRGDAERTRLQVERMGGNLAVTAVDERCAGEKHSQPCESLMHVFLPYRGELVPFAELGLRRVRFGENTEPGIPGRVRYELVTSP